MKVRRRQLDIPQRRHAERELVELIVLELTAAEVERRTPPHAGAELRSSTVGEGLPAKERSVVAARATRPSEEQEPAAFLLDAESVVLMTQVMVEGGIGLH